MPPGPGGPCSGGPAGLSPQSLWAVLSPRLLPAPSLWFPGARSAHAPWGDPPPPGRSGHRVGSAVCPPSRVVAHLLGPDALRAAGGSLPRPLSTLLLRGPGSLTLGYLVAPGHPLLGLQGAPVQLSLPRVAGASQHLIPQPQSRASPPGLQTRVSRANAKGGEGSLFIGGRETNEASGWPVLPTL